MKPLLESSLQIQTMRKRARLTQAELAKKMGTSVRTVSGWETGDRLPRNGILEEVAHICNQNGSMKIVESSTQEETYQIRYEEGQKEIIGVQKKVSELQERVIELQERIIELMDKK
jgi:transcriptional regulator with XRE-family HTH domain